MKKKRILVLGSSGQIGEYLCNYLEDKNYTVVKFDFRVSPKQDLRKENNLILKKLIKSSDYIFFLAFDVGGSRYLKNYQNNFNFLSNNLKIMTHTFNLLSKFNKKFLFASSQMSNMTYSNYGLLKLVGERVTQSLNSNYVKFWNVYGIEKDLKKAHVITDFVKMAVKKKNISMITDGKESREFLHALDCCEGLEIIMKRHDEFRKIKQELHLTTGIKIKIATIAEIIKNIAKKNKNNIKITKGKSKDQVQLNKKNKFNKFLSKYWKPKVNIKAGISEIYDYYLKK